jgi:hypothetical protein
MERQHLLHVDDPTNELIPGQEWQKIRFNQNGINVVAIAKD